MEAAYSALDVLSSLVHRSLKLVRGDRVEQVLDEACRGGRTASGFGPEASIGFTIVGRKTR